MKNEAGKGDSYRKVNPKKWAENYERIFGKNKCQHTITNVKNVK